MKEIHIFIVEFYLLSGIYLMCICYNLALRCLSEYPAQFYYIAKL